VEEKDTINATEGCEVNDIEPSLASMHLPSEVLQLVCVLHGTGYTHSNPRNTDIARRFPSLLLRP
jgi:hypothetical protein